MRFLTVSSWLLSEVGLASALPQATYDNSGYGSWNHSDEQEAARREVDRIQKDYEAYIHSQIRDNKYGCTEDSILYRQQWGAMPEEQRLEYVEAVKCLQTKPSRYSKELVPGSRSLFDDFAALHILDTGKVHYSGNFLTFHRHFVYLYERALREECGYTGAQPYWDWSISWEDPAQNPVFDGSPHSMGSNGAYENDGNTSISAFTLNINILPGTGGGCIHSGPFSDLEIHLGPVAFEPRGPDGGLGYNPRCLTRDLNPNYSRHTKPTDVLSAITNCTDVECFQNQFEFDINGLHAAGHFSIGGLGIDAFAGPQDPVFFLHHSMIDRVWTLWQTLDREMEERGAQLWGTETAFNDPPSDNVTLDTRIEFGVFDYPQRIGHLVSTIGGPYCYMYI